MNKKALITLALIITCSIMYPMTMPYSIVLLSNEDEQELANALISTATNKDTSFIRKKKNLFLAKKVIAAGATVNSIYGYMALHLAASNGKFELCKLLLEHGAPVNNRDYFSNSTPFMAAASSGYGQVCELLAQHGAQINWTDIDGNTALIYAAMSPIYWEKRIPICELLLDLLQMQINSRIKTLLLCLYRLKKTPHENNMISLCAQELYRNLIRPYLENLYYEAAQELLDTRNEKGLRAYDYLPIECLNKPSRRSPGKIKENRQYRLLSHY